MLIGITDNLNGGHISVDGITQNLLGAASASAR